MKISRTIVIVAAAICVSTAAQAGTALYRNCAASPGYWAWLEAMTFPADRVMPKEADIGRASPLHPAYYAGKGTEPPAADTGAVVYLAEMNNPLHPQFHRH
jgi:hypothetical protein